MLNDRFYIILYYITLAYTVSGYVASTSFFAHVLLIALPLQIVLRDKLY